MYKQKQESEILDTNIELSINNYKDIWGQDK